MRRHGGRVTSSRRLLLDVLFTDPEHRSAEELAARVQAQAPDVHLSTVYRNLEELERLGVVVHTHVGHGPATYHLASSIHGHFVCERCGTMTEVPENLFAELGERREKRPTASRSTPTTSPSSAGAGTAGERGLSAAPSRDRTTGARATSRTRPSRR